MTINKKKYNVSWSIFNIGKSSNELVVNLQNYSDSLFVVIGGLSWFNINHDYTLFIGFIGLTVNKLISGLQIEEV